MIDLYNNIQHIDNIQKGNKVVEYNKELAKNMYEHAYKYDDCNDYKFILLKCIAFMQIKCNFTAH